MAVILQKSYGTGNRTDLISGEVLAVPGLRLIDTADLVGPTFTNRPLEGLLKNDQEMNLHLNQVTSLIQDGVFPNFGEAFLPVLTSGIEGSELSFEVREGLGVIGDNAFHVEYRPNSQQSYEYDAQNRRIVPIQLPPVVTELNISVTNIGANQFRRDLIVLNNAGEVVVITGAVSSVLPAEYSQLDAPQDTIALYSILFRRVGGVLQQPTINAVYNETTIEGAGLIERFTSLFGNGIFPGEPEDVTDPLKKEFYPEIAGRVYTANAGSALIDGTLVNFSEAGSSINLAPARTSIGIGETPGPTQGNNSNNWELIDFNSTDEGASGTGNGNTQYLKYDESGLAGSIDAGTIKIFTAATTGEGGFTTERTFDTNVLSSPGTEEYSIDLTNGTIRREKTTAPLKVYIKYEYQRNRRYLPYISSDGSLNAIQSSDTYPEIPAEFSESALPENTIGLRSIVFNSLDSTLQEDSFGQDFRKFITFKLVDGKIVADAIADNAIEARHIADGAIAESSDIADGVIVTSHLADELQDFLSTSRVRARNSLAFQREGSETTFTFVDYKNAAGTFFTKQLTDLAGNPLTIFDAELQTPVSRPVVQTSIFNLGITTPVGIDPETTRANFTITESALSNAVPSDNLATIDSVTLSFADFGFSQVGDIIALIYDPDTGNTLGQAQVPLATIRTSVVNGTNTFYTLPLDSNVNVEIGKQYQLRVAKTVPSDTALIHTSVDGTSRPFNITYKVNYLPDAGKYGLISNRVQGYRIYDDFGDITVENTEREAFNKPSVYIPYAATITNPDTFNVFEDGNNTNYVAVDLTRGIFKFSDGSQPQTSRLLVDFNINQGFSELSSARIHRQNGQTIETALNILENELGSIKANVRNNLERLYYLGDGKFRFSSQDRALTDLDGTALERVDGNPLNVIHVIDQRFIVENGKESERAINETFGLTNSIEFTPRFSNIGIFALNIVEPGTNYTAIQVDLHAGEARTETLNATPISTQTIAKSAINRGLNFFTLETDLNVGETYHVYVKILGYQAASTTKPTLLIDVETGDIEYYEYFLPESGRYGTPDGYSIFDEFGDLNLGSASRGSEINASQENFLDADGWQIQRFFDDDDNDPTLANTTFPLFTPTKPSATGMVRFDIYFKTVPQPGEDGYNGVYRLLLHDSNNQAVIPNNALPGQNYIDVPVPKETGWQEVQFVASLDFGETYHMHMWSNGFDLQLYVGENAVTQEKAFRYIAGDRFVLFAANLCEGDNFDTFEVPEQHVAVDVTCGRIKFNENDLTVGNTYVANFNLFTPAADVQSDTIVRPNGETIENALNNTVSVTNSQAIRAGIDQYTFNAREVNLVDSLGRSLDRKDGELPVPYKRLAIEDTDTGGTPTQITDNETDNNYTFFVNYHEQVEVPQIDLTFTDIDKDSFDIIYNVYLISNQNDPVATGKIFAKDLKIGLNEITLEDENGNPLNLIVQPNQQYIIKYATDSDGATSPAAIPTLAQNSNNTITTNVYIKPTDGGLYGTTDGVTILDDEGDIYRFNYFRDQLENPFIGATTDSGAVNMKAAKGTDRGIVIWEELNNIAAARFDLNTGEFVDTQKLQIAFDSGAVATTPDLYVYENIAYTVWEQNNAVYGRRIFIDSETPLDIDSGVIKLSDDDASGVANPKVAVGRDTMTVVWEDLRHRVGSGTVPSEQNDINLFAFTYNNATENQFFDATTNADKLFRINSSDLDGAEFTNASVAAYQNKVVVAYETDINNLNLSKDIYLSVIDTDLDVDNTVIRSDIRVDEAPFLDTNTQVDSRDVRVASYKDHFLITWLDNRDDTDNNIHHIYGKKYNVTELTFETADTKMEFESTSGVASYNLDVCEKVAAISYIENTGGDNANINILKRYDFGSLTAHDPYYGFNVDYDGSLANITFDEGYPIVHEKFINGLSLSKDTRAIYSSRLEGINIEPVSINLTNFDTTTIPDGYIGIDVVTGRFKFAPGAEV